MNSSSSQEQASRASASPSFSRYNRPGLSALSYRGAPYLDAVRRMLARLPSQRVADACDLARPPLAALNRDIHEDWALALLHAWAVVTDVLTFYQERIVNEGYLRSAREYRSVLELARSVGYELRPGLAASAYLAFTVLSVKDEPPRQAAIPRGTAVQSVPAPRQLPQIFETSADFTARAEWNALRPARVSDDPVSRDLRPNATAVCLDGTSTGLRPNDRLLIMSTSPASTRAWRIVVVAAVKPDSLRGNTLVTWAPQGDATLVRDAAVFALLPPAPLFGYSPGGVCCRFRTAAAWGPSAIGLPKASVRALLQSDARVFAGTEKDLYRSDDRGESWQPCSVSLVPKDLHALAADEQGNLYAGADDGSIYGSRDQGDTWLALSGDLPPAPPKGLQLPGQPPSGPMPKTVVRALAAYAEGDRPCLAAGTNDGVLRSFDRGKTWQPANDALPKVDPKTGLTPVIAWALAVAGRDTRPSLFAGTDAGVFPIKPSPRWALAVALGLGLGLLLLWLAPGLSLLDLLLSAAANLLNLLIGLVNAGLALIKSWLTDLPDLQKSLPKNLDTFALPPLSQLIKQLPLPAPLLTLLAGTIVVAANIFLSILSVLAVVVLTRLLDQALGRMPALCLGKPVHTLAAASNGQLFAGTPAGLFCSNDDTTPASSLGRRIWQGLSALALGDLARRWQPAGAELSGMDISALALSEEGGACELLAGTSAGRVFRSLDRGATWQPLDQGLKPQPILALHMSAAAYYAAGPAGESAPERAWSPFQLQQCQVDLDRVYADMLLGSPIVLQQAGQPAALYDLRASSLQTSADALKHGAYTRLVVDRADGLADFDRSQALVLARGAALPCYDDRPIEGDTLHFDSFVPGLSSGQLLILSGKRARARWAPDAGVVLLRSTDGLREVAVQPGEQLQLVARALGGPSGSATWQLRHREGLIVDIAAPAIDHLFLEPANDDDETISEVVAIAGIAHGAERTTVTLRTPLAYVYDRATVTLNGNIVDASHGQTVANELLGSSESMSTNQHFLLKQAPLTYVAAPNASGAASTLTVRVNGVRWEEVSFLHQRARNRHAYMLRQHAPSGPPMLPGDIPRATDAAARPALLAPSYPPAELIFGDGSDGAGLPTGTWQIEASYRVGLGSAGNLPPASLSVLQTPLRDIKAVANPLAASGGSDPETMDHARTQVPLTLQSMQRIVSSSDYADFVCSFAGIGKVRVDSIRAGSKRLLHLTIAGTDGNCIPKSSQLYQDLSAAIERYRVTPVPPVYLDSYEPLYFNIKARLQLAPDRRDPRARAAICLAARAVLADRFAFACRDFGQPVAEAEVIAAIQSVEGVVAVELAQLFVEGTPPMRARLLEALPARRAGASLLPAQLLLVNTIGEQGIVLEIADDTE